MIGMNKKQNGKRNFFYNIKIISFILTLMVGVIIVIDDSFASVESKREELESVRSNLRSVRKELDIANVQEQDLARQLQRTQSKIRILKRDIKYLSHEISGAQVDIRQLRKHLDTLQKEYAQKQQVMQKRIKEIFASDQTTFMDVLTESSSFSDFINHADFSQRLVKQDEELIKSLKLQQEAIRFKQREINDKYNRMLSYRGRLKQKQESLQGIEQTREKLLAEVEKKRNYYQLKKYELEDHTYELEQEIQGMIREEQYNRGYNNDRGGSNRSGGYDSTPVYSTGVFLWPCSAYITSDYGWRIHPIYGYSRFHTGIDLGADYGVSIKAADGGTVIYSGWCGGYGNTVMIDHGGGISTLYGHCSEVYVSYGQGVAKGQVVASVGSTGNSTGPHLHFEVRQDGVPVSPWGYLK